MQVRNDLRNTRDYHEIVRKYKKESIRSFKKFVVFSGLFWFIGGIYLHFTSDNIGFFACFLMFLLGLFVVGGVTLYSQVANYKVVILTVTNKNSYRDDDNHMNYNISEGKEVFSVDNVTLWNNISVGTVNTFVCKGKHIIGVLNYLF